nr:immunoglobulin heavy chain junction region [Macaca mulatta]MOW77567.1 immunoglobulin heavy chain junction region [Macaca mulatta]MOW78119.1 immunoglobulin heavy chain junction region [Macaca mulatta]MOW85054.1 immunoglobulin heavy chain junction region [Macaca mulatta]MOW85320.1 immunoglobulin heavy chain junction region [Macaca mulatta]
CVRGAPGLLRYFQFW